MGQVLLPVRQAFEMQVCHALLAVLHHRTNKKRPLVLATPDGAEEIAKDL